MSERKTYRLYASRVTEDNIKYAEKHRFYRVSSSYILIYEELDLKKNEEMNDIGYRDISENGLAALSSGDKDWLFQCNSILILENTKDEEETFLAVLDGKIKKLEQELKKQSDSLNGAD